MHTRWPVGENSRDDLSFWCSVAVRVFYFDSVWHYAAIATEDDDPLWSVLLCLVCRRNDRGELGDVADQALM